MGAIDHERASGLLAAFADGSIDPRLRDSLERHVEICTECRSWLASYRLLTTTLRHAERLPAEHLGGDELVAHTLAPESLPAVARLRNQQHLTDCRQCRHERALVLEAVASARNRTIGRSGRPVWLALAASLLLVIGALATYIAVRVPDDYTLSSVRLSGSQRFRAHDSIVIEASEVPSGVSLTLQAGERVTLGDGFSVRSGASLEILLSAGEL